MRQTVRARDSEVLRHLVREFGSAQLVPLRGTCLPPLHTPFEVTDELHACQCEKNAVGNGQLFPGAYQLVAFGVHGSYVAAMFCNMDTGRSQLVYVGSSLHGLDWRGVKKFSYASFSRRIRPA